jgi:hypothetical protein
VALAGGNINGPAPQVIAASGIAPNLLDRHGLAA